MLLLREVTAVDTDLLSQFGFICAVCTILLVHDKHKYIVQFRVSGKILHQLNSTPDELGVLDKHLCLMASRIAFQCVAALCENPQRPVLVSNGRIDDSGIFPQQHLGVMVEVSGFCCFCFTLIRC